MSTPPPPPGDPNQSTGWGDSSAGQSTPQSQGGQQPQWGQQQPGQYQAPGQDQGYGGSPENAPGAIASLVFGILGIIVLPVVFSIVAIVLGNKSKKETAANPGRYTDSLGQVGRILGWIGLILGILGILVIVLFFGAIVASGDFNSP